MTQKGDVQLVQGALQAFIPEGLTMNRIQLEVLSPAMASALRHLQHLAHSKSLESCVKTITGVLQHPDLQDCFKPLQRLTTLTQFKKLMLAAHNQVSVMEMDKQVADTAKKLEAGVDQLRQRLIDSDAEFHQGKLTFTTVKELLTDIVGLKAKVAQLPQTETSTHFAIGQGVWQAILQETE